MQNNIKVSFIVPAYNVSKYIKRCVDSLLDQNFKDFEVIVINDGSTDNTCDILSEMKNIVFINQTNSGSSIARNNGIKQASGEYIAFVDGDDFITGDYAKETYEFATKYDADIVVCDFYKNIKNQDKYITDFSNQESLIDKKDYFLKLVKSKKVSHNIWNKLYKKSLFDDIKFPEKVFLGEDLNAYFKLVHKSNRIVKLNKAFYHYVIGDNNTSGFGSLKGVLDHKFVYDDLIEFCNLNLKGSCEYVQILVLRQIKGVYFPIIFSKADLSNESYMKAIELLKNDTDKIFANPGFKKLRMKYKVLFYLLRRAKKNSHMSFILNFFNKINNVFSQRKQKDFRP